MASIDPLMMRTDPEYAMRMGNMMELGSNTYDIPKHQGLGFEWI